MATPTTESPADTPTTEGPFFVFRGVDYYPSGGMGDFQDAHPTLAAAKASCTGPKASADQWAEIATIHDGSLRLVARGSRNDWRAPWTWSQPNRR